MGHVRPRALIIGANGQDGVYLAECLFEHSYEVYGTVRAASRIPPTLNPKIAGMSVIDLTTSHGLTDVIREVRPDTIYYLAAHHFSSQATANSADFGSYLSVNLVTVHNALELLRVELPESRFFYAASSHIFGVPNVCPQTETTPQRPDSPYAISKSAAFYLCRYYRERYKLHTSVGILYNHESPLRSESFITTQIAIAAARAMLGKPELLVVRDLGATVDWGAAQDYVQAMRLTLEQPFGDEYIIASGIPRTVRDFANEAFEYVGLRADDFIVQNQQPVSNNRMPYVGDSSKIRRVCSWVPRISFRDLVRSMVDAQLHKLKTIPTV